MIRQHFQILTALVVTSILPAFCSAEDIQFNPQADYFASQSAETYVVPATARLSDPAVVDDRMTLRNFLVLGGLGLMFSVGTAITVSTIRQKQSAVPHQANFYVS